MLADALLVIDLQNGVCHDNGKYIDHYEELIDNANNLIEQYRQAGKSIVFIQHNEKGLEKGTPAWQLVSALHHEPMDIDVDKTHANSFYHTNLKTVLDQIQATSLEICGAQTEYCIDGTVKMAHGLGYQVQMRKNASSTYDSAWMTAPQTVTFFEHLWQQRYLNLY